MIKKWMPQYQGKPMPPDEIDICPKCSGTGYLQENCVDCPYLVLFDKKGERGKGKVRNE